MQKGSEFPIDTIRHSTSHLMAAAIRRLYPGVKFGVGPAIDNGFYYDVRLPGGQSLSEADLRRVEEEMVKIQQEKHPLKKEMLNMDEAIKLMQEMGQTYKVELLDLLRTKGSTAVSKEVKDDSVVVDGAAEEGVKAVSVYHLGEFTDLCRGPHVGHTGQTGVFKLNNVTSAYWRGKAENDALIRIYGLCFSTLEELQAEEKRLEDLKEADHRHLGAKHDLFFFAPLEIGVGLPLWTPHGTVLRKELEWLAMEFERSDNYKTVVTTELARESLYERSRHLPYYEADMYKPIDIEGEKYRLRPMNCPHHHMEYLHKPRSYRDLPIRFAEHGKVFRFEHSGALTGLLRTRGFTQNDAHMYCRYDQAKDLFLEVMRLHLRYYKLLGIEKYYMRLSLPDMANLGKYVDQPEKWTDALNIIRQAMIESGCEYKEVEGEAAFYGPKVDFQIYNAYGTEYTISTNQLDFLATQTFGLSYTGEDGQHHPVYVVHRTPLGSHERFVAFLIEHYKAAFPVWLAPVQIKILSVSQSQNDYANQVKEFFFQADVRTATGGLRIEVDDSDLKLAKKIFNAQQEKSPYIIVVGDKEVANNTIAVRLRNNKTVTFKVDDFLKRIKYEVEHRLDFSSQEKIELPEKKKTDFSQFLITRPSKDAGSSSPSPSPASAEPTEHKEHKSPILQ